MQELQEPTGISAYRSDTQLILVEKDQMSLSLVQGYESEDDAKLQQPLYVDSDGEDEDPTDGETEAGESRDSEAVYGQVADLAAKITPPGEKHVDSSLPSALHVFSEVEGPPEFLRPPAFAATPTQKLLRNNMAAADTRRRDSAEAVIVRKAQRGAPSVSNPAVGGVGVREEGEKRVKGAQLPPIQDAAHLLSVCDKCQVPKTFSTARGGLVCPMCSDKAPQTEAPKKRESAVKDKEKVKRMKGQSTHATWKSETEMQLRQTYD